MSVELNAASLKAVLSASEVVQAMLAQGPVILTDWLITTQAIEGGYRVTFRRGSEEQVMDILDGAVGPEGPQGETGATGQRGSTWFRGNSVAGTDTVDWESGFIEENEVQVGDYYLNTDTFNMYVWVFSYDMTTGETTKTWHYLGCIKGEQGEQGEQGLNGTNGTNGTSAKWYTGTKITGISTSPTHFTGSDTGSVNAGDMYLNTSTGRVYRCYSGGSSYGATWVYACDITGPRGLQGEDGAAGYTPIKGTDYYTEADKAEMVSAVIAALPVYDGEVVEV